MTFSRAAAVAALVVAVSYPVRHLPVAAAPRCWRPPVVGEVVDPFRPPPCPWCAGNRGIEYATEPGSPVRAAAPGVVSFAGPVAGTNYVVVDLGDGRRLTYGRVATVAVAAGQAALEGMQLATTGSRVFFGLRVGEEYHDPAPLLGELVGVARLVPDDGATPRPAPPPRTRCVRAR